MARRSAEAESWQHWYKTKRWQRLRANQLKAHPYCQCVLHKGKRVPADTVDHKEAHKGDPRKFWNPRNLQSLTRHCHDSHKQRQERSGVLRGANPDGTPIDPNHPWNLESAQETGAGRGHVARKPKGRAQAGLHTQHRE